jgi:hypothetical protein
LRRTATYFSRVDAKRLQATEFSRCLVPICTRYTLVDLTRPIKKVPHFNLYLVASSPGARPCPALGVSVVLYIAGVCEGGGGDTLNNEYSGAEL